MYIHMHYKALIGHQPSSYPKQIWLYVQNTKNYSILYILVAIKMVPIQDTKMCIAVLTVNKKIKNDGFLL